MKSSLAYQAQINHKMITLIMINKKIKTRIKRINIKRTIKKSKMIVMSSIKNNKSNNLKINNKLPNKKLTSHLKRLIN